MRHSELSELFRLQACQCFLPFHRVISVETRIFWHGLGRSDKVWLLRPAQPAWQQTEGLVKKPRRQTWVVWRWYIAPSASVALLFHYFQLWRGSCLPHSLKHNMKDHRFQPRVFFFPSSLSQACWVRRSNLPLLSHNNEHAAIPAARWERVYEWSFVASSQQRAHCTNKDGE